GHTHTCGCQYSDYLDVQVGSIEQGMKQLVELVAQRALRLKTEPVQAGGNALASLDLPQVLSGSAQRHVELDRVGGGKPDVAALEILLRLGKCKGVQMDSARNTAVPAALAVDYLVQDPRRR